MKTIPAFLATAALTCALWTPPASAEVRDISIETCKSIVGEKDLTILYWMAGYHTTEEQGTIVDNAKLSDAIDQTVAYCTEHPGFALLSSAQKFMGEHMDGEPGPKAVDVATVTCGDYLRDETYTNTFVWMMGYHASTNTDSTIFDSNKMDKNGKKIGKYCAAHPEVGLMTASEKFLADE